MFLELMVATVCIAGQGNGCSETTSAYYKQSVELQYAVKRIEDFGKKVTNNNQWVVYAATPVYAVAAGQPARFHIYKGTVFGVNVREESVFFQWTY